MYLKVPTEMAEFALRERKVNEVMVYLASQFIYSGKSKIEPSPVHSLREVVPIKERTIYKHLSWLINRNWIGLDEQKGWYHFGGINKVHHLEGWRFSRATKLYKKDLHSLKSYLTGSFLASLIKSGRLGKETERKPRRSEPLFYPVSHSAISKILHLSKSSVKRLIKQAEDNGYIKTRENLIQVKNMTINDLNQAKSVDIPALPVELLGYSDERVVPLERFRYLEKGLFIQEPNIVYSLLEFKSRRGLSKYR